MYPQHGDMLFRDDEKYAGKFVATPSFSDNSIVGSGSTFDEVYDMAEEKGYKDPIVTKIPEKGAKFLF